MNANMHRIFILPILLIMALLPVGTAFAIPLLSLTITANGPVAPGQNASFTITVSNTGNTTTSTFNLVATVPNNTMVPGDQDEGATCSSTGFAATDCLAGQNLSWQVNLAAGTSLSRTFTAVVDSTAPPPNGTLLSTIVNTSFDGGGAVTGQVVVGGDTDGDGIPDTADNCIEVSNPGQQDTNGDGFGNICDPDLNGDLKIDFADLAILKSVFFVSAPNMDADFNSDGRADFADLVIMKSKFFGTPGPSALAP